MIPGAVDSPPAGSHDRVDRRGKDAAGLVALTPWIKLYPAGAMYPLIGAYSPWSNLCLRASFRRSGGKYGKDQRAMRGDRCR